MVHIAYVFVNIPFSSMFFVELGQLVRVKEKYHFCRWEGNSLPKSISVMERFWTVTDMPYNNHQG